MRMRTGAVSVLKRVGANHLVDHELAPPGTGTHPLAETRLTQKFHRVFF